MASPQLQRVIGMMRKADPLASGDLMTIRKITGRAPAYPKPDDITWEAVNAGGVPAEWVVPDDCVPGRVIVYFHGGGYATGTIHANRGLCSHIARATRARVLSVDYRLAPEHRFPAAVDDALAAYRFVVSEGYAPENVALGGDSSGAGLVLGTLVALRDGGEPLPGAAICICPWTDLTLSGATVDANRDKDPMVRASVLALMAEAYLGDADPRSPTASPLFADLTGLPPLLVQVGSAELLLDDSQRFAERAQAAGVDVTLEIWDDMIHVWHSFADMLPEGKEAVARIGSYADDHLTSPPAASTVSSSPTTTPHTRNSMNDLLSIARSLRPLVEAEADAVDRELTLTQPLIEAFAKTGLSHLQVPKELGGLEADVDTTLDVLEELAYQDGSIGWSFMANGNATAVSAMLDPIAARRMLEGGPGIVFAGQLASRGKARRVDGGFQVQGRFQFGSGSAHASWIGGGALVYDAEGNRELNDAGTPAVLAFYAPRDNVELTGNWDVMGLRGTGSFDYTIPEQFVEEGRTFWLFDGEPRCGGGVYRLGAVAFAGIGHAGWALGVARRALDEIQAIAMSGRARIGGTAMRDQQVFQRAFSENTLALRSARLVVHDTIGDIVRRLDAGDPMTKAMRDELVSAVAYQTRVCMDVVEFAYMSSGSSGLRNPSILQRCFRDMCVGAQHIYVDPRTFDEMGKGLLGVG